MRQAKTMAMYRVIYHDTGEPLYGLHEVRVGDNGEVVWWNREAVQFSCDASEGREGVAQSLMVAAGDAGRWPALMASELPE